LWTQRFGPGQGASRPPWMAEAAACQRGCRRAKQANAFPGAPPNHPNPRPGLRAPADAGLHAPRLPPAVVRHAPLLGRRAAGSRHPARRPHAPAGVRHRAAAAGVRQRRARGRAGGGAAGPRDDPPLGVLPGGRGAGGGGGGATPRRRPRALLPRGRLRRSLPALPPPPPAAPPSLAAAAVRRAGGADDARRVARRGRSRRGAPHVGRLAGGLQGLLLQLPVTGQGGAHPRIRPSPLSGRRPTPAASGRCLFPGDDARPGLGSPPSAHPPHQRSSSPHTPALHPAPRSSCAA
jgi:hypothetical protein